MTPGPIERRSAPATSRRLVALARFLLAGSSAKLVGRRGFDRVRRHGCHPLAVRFLIQEPPHSEGSRLIDGDQEHRVARLQCGLDLVIETGLQTEPAGAAAAMEDLVA